MGVQARFIHFLRRSRSDESGQSLVVIALAMTVIIALAAFAIDAAGWMQRHHQAQVVADAAALAAANCLANPGHASSININGVQTAVPACSSSTDATDATTVARDYAAANGVPIINPSQQIQVDTSRDKVTVSPSTSSPGLFASLFGVHTTTETATAGASWTTGSSACSNPGKGCDFFFAHDSNCTSGSNGISFSFSGTTTVSGNIQSNASLSGATSGSISLGTATYGPSGTGTCKNSVIYSGQDPWTTPPTQESTDLPWPVDYTKDFPACGGSGELACAPNGYPTFCTNAASSITLISGVSGDSPISGNIYCASGSGSKSDPSTWNGSITITLSGTNTLYDTFVGGTISYTPSGTATLSSCGYATAGYAVATCSASVPSPTTTNYPIFYATGTGSSAISLTTSGTETINGDVFAPNGTARLTMSGTSPVVTFVEAKDINATISGTFKGDGPTGTITGSTSSGSDSLTQ